MPEELEEVKEVNGQKGLFAESVYRNNSQIRKDRADAILETAQLMYRRKVEDIQIVLKNLIRERNNALDFSPVTAESLEPAKNFKPENFIADDMSLTLQIRTKKIELEEAQVRYKELFGEEV